MLGQDVCAAAEAIVVMEGVIAGCHGVIRSDSHTPAEPSLLWLCGVLMRIRELVSRDTDTQSGDHQ